MTIETISLIISSVGLAFLLFGMFWGIVRGFKKSLFRGIWLVSLAIIVFLLTPTISAFIYNFNLSFLNLNIGGEQVTSVFGMLNTYVSSVPQVAEFVEEYPQMIALIEQLLILAINVFIFTLSFWILKMLTWPIWAIVSAVVFKKKKIISDGKRIILRPKKYKFFGMLLGAVLGVFVLSMTLMPITGTINFARELDSQEFYGSESGVVTTLVGEDAMEYVDTLYSDSILGKVLQYSGINALTNTMFKHLTTSKVDGETISLTSEAALYLDLYNSLNTIKDTDFGNLTKESLAAFLNSSESIVKKLFSSKVLKVAGDSVIPYALSYVEENESYTNFVNSITIEQLQSLVTEGYTKFKTSNINSLQQDLLNLIYVAKSLNNSDVIIPTINGSLQLLDYIDLVDDDLITEVTNYLFKMPSVAKVYPIFLNKGLSYLGNVLGFTYTEQDFSNTALSSQDFANILKGGMAVVRTINFDYEYYITNPSFEAIGGFMDIIRNLNFLQNGLYDTIVEKLFDKGITFINNTSLSDDVKSLIASIVDDVEDMITNEEVSLKSEFRQYGELFDDVKLIIEDFQTTALSELVLSDYGEILDNLNETHLFGEILPTLIDTGWALVKSSVTSALPEQFSDIETIVTNIKNNIILILQNQKLPEAERTISSTTNLTLSLKTEFTHLQSLFNFINTSITPYFSTESSGTEGLMDDLFGEGTLFIDFGKELDKLVTTNKSLILTDGIVKNLVSQAFTMISSMVTDTNINTFVTTISTNIKNSTATINWEGEFGYFKELGGMMDTDDFSFSSIGAAFDTLSQSTFVPYSAINTFLSGMMQTQYDGMTEEQKTDFVEDLFTQIKANILSINSAIYEDELEYIEDLLDLSDTGSTLDYANIGAQLDAFNGSVVVGSLRKSLIINILEEKLTDVTLDSNAISFIQTIKNNAANIPSTIANNFYTVEFGNLTSVLNLTIPSSEIGITTELLSDYGNTFYEMSNSVLSFNIGEKVMDIILDSITTTDTQTYVTVLSINILGSVEDSVTGILPANRKNTTLTSEEQLTKKTNYVKAFTELKDLLDILDSVEAISDYTNYSTIGGYLTSINQLSIAKRPNATLQGVDQKIASKVLEELQTQITSELNTQKQDAVDEINANMSLTQTQKDELIADISELVVDAQASINTQIATTQVTIDLGVSNYTTVLTALGGAIETIIDDLTEDIEDLI